MGRFHRIYFRALICLLAASGVAGCRVEEDELPQVQLPAPTPPPPAPVVTPADTSAVPIDTAHWRNFSIHSRSFVSPAPGRFEFTSDGVKGYNESALFGSILSTAYNYNLDNRSIRLTWMCNDGGSSSNFTIAFADSSGYIYDPVNNLAHFIDLNKLSTRSSYSGSPLIRNNVWYFTSLSTTATQYTINTAIGDFAENGGTQVESRSGPLIFHRGRVLLRSDQPGSAGCSMVINRLVIH